MLLYPLISFKDIIGDGVILPLEVGLVTRECDCDGWVLQCPLRLPWTPRFVQLRIITGESCKSGKDDDIETPIDDNFDELIPQVAEGELVAEMLIVSTDLRVLKSRIAIRELVIMIWKQEKKEDLVFR